MTKNHLTREENVQAVFDLKAGYTLGLADVEILKRVARMALAAMGSEPVGYFGRFDPDDEDLIDQCSKNVKGAFPLYRHAQQPLVPDNRAITQHFDTIALETAREILCDVNRRHEFLGGEVQLLSRIQCRIDAACRAAILQAQSDDDGEPTDDERIMAIEGIHNCERCGDEGWVMGEMGITRCACGQAGNSPVIPEGYVMVPKEPTAEMISSGIAAHYERSQIQIHDRPATGPMECAYIAMLAAAPQEPKP